MEDEVLANAGVDVFEEVFKLIFTKLYDEMESGRNETRHLEFRNYGDTETELKDKIQKLFDEAKNKWDGVFSEEAKILLSPSYLSVCVSSLQDVKLFNSNLDVVDDAFEYLMSKSSKGEKGQYFTPRYVIDMCVKMLNPKSDETMIDPASGSGSLLIRAADEAPTRADGSSLVDIYGQEKYPDTAGLAKMNFILHNKATGEIKGANTLSDPQYINDFGELTKFDFIVMNLPFSDKDWIDGIKVEKDKFKRFDGV